MRRDVEGLSSAEGKGELAAVRLKLGQRLIEELRPLLDQHGVETETLDGDSKEASLEAGGNGKDKDVSGGELRSSIVVLVLWKFFVRCEESRWTYGQPRTGYGGRRRGLGGGTRHPDHLAGSGKEMENL